MSIWVDGCPMGITERWFVVVLCWSGSDLLSFWIDRSQTRGGGFGMITERFDRRTVAVMEVALDRACERWPNGGEHVLRKRVAQSIIRCAQTGNTCLGALVEAGERAVVRQAEPG